MGLPWTERGGVVVDDLTPFEVKNLGAVFALWFLFCSFAIAKALFCPGNVLEPTRRRPWTRITSCRSSRPQCVRPCRRLMSRCRQRHPRSWAPSLPLRVARIRLHDAGVPLARIQETKREGGLGWWTGGRVNGGWVGGARGCKTDREAGGRCWRAALACFGLLDARAWVWIAAKVWETIRKREAASTSFRDVRARGGEGGGV